MDAKSNEITAIPQLIELLDLQDCVVTIDAAGCQKEIAAKIVAKEADYVLALKENQPTLYEQAAEHFLQQLEEEKRRQDATPSGGREGPWSHRNAQHLRGAGPKEMAATGAWLGLASIVMVIRHCVDHATGKTSDEVRYFISSLPPKVRRLAGAVRRHWGIENGLHWVLDVAFNEDRMRQRDRNGIENLALLNRLAVSLLRQDKSIKAGVKCKRKTAGWDDDYLLHLLFDCE